MMRALFPAIVLFLCLAVSIDNSLCCDVSSLDVSISTTPGNLTSDAYSVQDIYNHFEAISSVPFASDINSTFSCVDARLDTPILGTPGGDFAELVVALKTYFDMKKVEASATIIRRVFLKFMSEIATSSRPFYYHTDFAKMNYFFADLKEKYNITATIFPVRTPANVEIWLREYVKPKYQGCGHVRLMIQHPSSYGLPNAFIPQTLLQEYLKYYWTSSAVEKRKIEFSVKLGTLSGKAVTIVNNVGPGCKGHSPKFITNLRGSSLFIFHANAAANFRNKVLAPLIHRFDNTIDQAQFIKKSNKLFETQLGATLSVDSPGLPPANAVRVFTLEVSTSGSSPATPTPPRGLEILLHHHHHKKGGRRHHHHHHHHKNCAKGHKGHKGH